MRACGLKQGHTHNHYQDFSVAPHAGVWIETSGPMCMERNSNVAPHAGVWIETPLALSRLNLIPVAPHAGVWIETFIARRLRRRY